MVEMPKTYAEIHDQLGSVIPCYAQRGIGCYADDDEGELCAEGCIMFRIWQHGYDAGRSALSQPNEGEGK